MFNLLIFFLILVVIIIVINILSNKHELFVNYTKCNSRKNTQITQEIFNKYDFNKTNKNNWDLYIPCGYNYIERELNNINVHNNKQVIFGIKGCDNFVSKNGIWSLLVKKYGRKNSCKIMPKSYVIRNPLEMRQFYQEHDPKKIYILKSNIQKQKGIKIVSNIVNINKFTGILSDYQIIQELLQNPFIVNGRKINLRIYVLIVCEKSKITAYIHNQGFMYYTPLKFKKNSIKKDVNITSGYVPRIVYKENPLTLQDFKLWLERRGYNKNSLFNNIDKMLINVFEAIEPSICISKHLNNNTRFQLFGADIAPDENLNCKLMEFNKGPDMGAKDERDKLVKKTVQEDIYNLLGLIKLNRYNEFKKIWTKKRN